VVRPARRWVVAGAFGIVAVVWGTTTFSIKVGLISGWQPLWFCAVRLLLAAAAVTPLLLTRLGGSPLGAQGRRAVLPLGVFGIALNFGITVWGQQYVGAGLASLIAGTQPVTTTLLARYSMGRPITARFASSLGLGVVGLAVIFGGDSVVGGMALLGALAVLAGVTIYGAIFVYINKNIGGLSVVRVVATQNLIGGMLVAMSAQVFEGLPVLPSDPNGYLALSYLVVAGSILALVLAVWLIGQLGAPRFSLMSFITPIIGVTFSVLWLDESVDTTLVVGALLVAAALALSLWPRKPSVTEPGPGPASATDPQASITCASRSGRSRWWQRPC
jgi:drug/metabolite transporter (DMT)-like permease